MIFSSVHKHFFIRLSWGLGIEHHLKHTVPKGLSLGKRRRHSNESRLKYHILHAVTESKGPHKQSPNAVCIVRTASSQRAVCDLSRKGELIP